MFSSAPEEGHPRHKRKDLSTDVTLGNKKARGSMSEEDRYSQLYLQNLSPDTLVTGSTEQQEAAMELISLLKQYPNIPLHTCFYTYVLPMHIHLN
jgi:hypothetical protein